MGAEGFVGTQAARSLPGAQQGAGFADGDHRPGHQHAPGADRLAEDATLLGQRRGLLEGVVETRRDVENALAASRKARVDHDKCREAVRLAARRAASRWTGKKPQVIVMMAEAS